MGEFHDYDFDKILLTSVNSHLENQKNMSGIKHINTCKRMI